MPCGKGKRVYFTKQGAKDAKRKINKDKRLDPVTNIYWCDDCSGHHLTTMDKKASRNITHRINKQKRS